MPIKIQSFLVLKLKILKNKKIVLGINEVFRLLSRHKSYSYQIQRTVSRARIIDFFKELNPVNFGFEMIRIGSGHDGGYLIPNDLEGVKKCISPGVGTSIKFEKNLADRFNIQSFLADPTVEIPPHMESGISFKKIGISYCSGVNQMIDMKSGEMLEFDSVTLEEFINDHTLENENELILQMDIENAEYLALLAAGPNVLNKFRIMIIEFHSIPKIFEEKYYTEIIKPLFNKLNQIFYIAHIHANNVAVPVKILNYEIPHAIEVTFHNRSRIISTNGLYLKEIYNKLDEPCDPTKPEVYLDFKLFNKN